MNKFVIQVSRFTPNFILNHLYKILWGSHDMQQIGNEMLFIWQVNSLPRASCGTPPMWYRISSYLLKSPCMHGEGFKIYICFNIHASLPAFWAVLQATKRWDIRGVTVAVEPPQLSLCTWRPNWGGRVDPARSRRDRQGPNRIRHLLSFRFQVFQLF